MNFMVYFIRTRQELMENADIGLLDRIYTGNDHVKRFGVPMEALFLVNVCITGHLTSSLANTNCLSVDDHW